MQSEVLRCLMPPLAVGCVGGMTAVGGLFVINTGSLRELICHSQSGWLAALLLCMGFVTTFAAAALGVALSRGEAAGCDDRLTERGVRLQRVDTTKKRGGETCRRSSHSIE